MTSLNALLKSTLITIFIMLVGCSSPNAASLAEISPSDASQATDSTNAVIIDVRTQAEWDEGHIPGAIHIPLDQVKNRLAEFEAYKNQPIIMQCHSGKRSAKAGTILIEAGYDNVSNLTGGIVAWSKAGLTTE